MNLILKFPDENQQSMFAEQLGRLRPDVASHYRPALTRPQAVLEGLTEEQSSWVRRSVSGLGAVYEDVQFEVFPPAHLK